MKISGAPAVKFDFLFFFYFGQMTANSSLGVILKHPLL